MAFPPVGLANAGYQAGSWALSTGGEKVKEMASAKFIDILVDIASFLFQFTVMLFQMTVYLFEISLEWSVVKFTENIENITMIDTGWTIIRDMVNVAFIFIILYIAIRIILQMNEASAKQMLVRVIVAALLINFSLFATKVVIDASNVLAIEFYNAVETVQPAPQDMQVEMPDGTVFVNEDDPIIVKGPASAIIGGLNIQTLLHQSDADPTLRSVAVVYIGGTVLLWVLMFVLGALAIMFLIRFVALIFYMVFSPIGFLGIILPQLSSVGGKWWNGLLKQAFFAPVALFMLFLVSSMVSSQSLVAVTSLPQGAANPALASAIQGDINHFGTLMNYFLIIALTCGALIISNSIGAHGAAAAVSVGKRTANGARGFAGRNTIGWAAQRAEERFGDSRLANTFVGSSLRDMTTRKLASAKYGGKKSAADAAKAEQKRRGTYEKVASESTAKTRERMTRSVDAEAERHQVNLRDVEGRISQDPRVRGHDERLRGLNSEANQLREQKKQFDGKASTPDAIQARKNLEDKEKELRRAEQEREQAIPGDLKRERDAVKREAEYAKKNSEKKHEEANQVAKKMVARQRQKASKGGLTTAGTQQQANILKEMEKGMGDDVGEMRKKAKDKQKKDPAGNLADAVKGAIEAGVIDMPASGQGQDDKGGTSQLK